MYVYNDDGLYQNWFGKQSTTDGTDIEVPVRLYQNWFGKQSTTSLA